MAKFLLINPANRLFGEHFKFASYMRADIPDDIRIRASISTHVPCNVIDNDYVTKSKWPTSKMSLMLFVEISTQSGPIKHESNTESAQRYEKHVQGMRRK